MLNTFSYMFLNYNISYAACPYLDPGDAGRRDAGDAGRVPLVLRESGPIEAAALKLESPDLHVELGPLERALPATHKLEMVHGTPQLPVVEEK